MTKDVLVSIKGLQTGEAVDDFTEVVCSGTYYFRNGKHYVKYDEITKENSMVSNTLIAGGYPEGFKVTLKRKGDIETNLVFMEGQNNVSCYETEYGSFMLGFQTRSISTECAENEIKIYIDYSLEMNYEYLSDNKIEISIVSKAL